MPPGAKRGDASFGEVVKTTTLTMKTRRSGGIGEAARGQGAGGEMKMRGEGGNTMTQEVLTLYDSCKEEVLTLYDTTTKRSGLPKGGYRRSLLVGGGAIAKTDGGKDTMDNRPKHQYFRNTVFPLISKTCQIV